MEIMVIVERKGKNIIYLERRVSEKKKGHMVSLVKLPAPNVDEVPHFGKIRKLQEMGLIVDGFPLDKNWDESQLKLHEC